MSRTSEETGLKESRSHERLRLSDRVRKRIDDCNRWDVDTALEADVGSRLAGERE